MISEALIMFKDVAVIHPNKFTDRNIDDEIPFTDQGSQNADVKKMRNGGGGKVGNPTADSLDSHISLIAGPTSV